MSAKRFSSEYGKEDEHERRVSFACPAIEAGRSCRKVFDTRCGLKKHLNMKHELDLVKYSSTEVYKPSREQLQKMLEVAQRNNKGSPKPRPCLLYTSDAADE